MQAGELNSVLVNPAPSFFPANPTLFKNKLAVALCAVVALHVLLIPALQPHAVLASRLCTAAVAGLAALCVGWRAARVPATEQFAWRWMAVAVALWALAHAAETFISGSNAASNLSVDPSDFIYVSAAFPLLLALSTTRETASIRKVFYLNSAQIVIALVLTYFLLFKTTLSEEAASTVMGKIYGVECLLLVIFAAMRSLTWETREEGRSIRSIIIFLVAYLPIELGMDYGSAHWGLRQGNLLDLAWSIPFVIAAGVSLSMPIDKAGSDGRRARRKGRTIAEMLCPTLISMGVFALAASVASQHLALALSAILLLLVLQGMQAGLLQVTYLNGQLRLLEREQDLRTANAVLEKLSLLDPLTSIPNRRRFDEALNDAWRRASRKNEPVSLLIIDLDFFKGINDRHGHGYGDECLISVAREISMLARRPDDLLARYGGDEFLLLLPGTDREGAYVMAERVQSAVSRLNLANYASPLAKRVTVSVGLGVAMPSQSIRCAALVDVADRALYEAKRQGRDRTCALILEPVV
ncbi:MAG TPA: diguanylate cyclase [Terracidiphilus sp.]|jgi:diguanylate cyclase (GGDEF)-like protein|nr:diguanylate cyclase [Terracidiphilus sp.]